MESNINFYLSIYKKIEPIIKKRFLDFENFESKSDTEIFIELCFCLFTPQNKAVSADLAIKKLLEKDLLFKGNIEEISENIKGLVRFHQNKAKYLVEARNQFFSEDSLSLKKILFESKKEIIEKRKIFYDRVLGLGMKESSHFLRNIGLGKDLAILDRHILKNLKKLNVIEEIPKTLTENIYLEIEKKMLLFSKKINIELKYLDFVFWYKETGKVFK